MDISNMTTKAILSQLDEKVKDHIIYYASWNLNKANENYFIMNIIAYS